MELKIEFSLSCSRAETYNGSPSPYFCDYANTATCYNCLFDAKRKEDTSATSWALSIATSVSGKNDKWTSKNKFSALWVFHKI